MLQFFGKWRRAAELTRNGTEAWPLTPGPVSTKSCVMSAQLERRIRRRAFEAEEEPMSKTYDEGRYLARSLAVTLLDLEPAQRCEILRYLQEEVERLADATEKDAFKTDEDEAKSSGWMADNDEGLSGNVRRKHEA
jgi:hypothetical protein